MGDTLGRSPQRTDPACGTVLCRQGDATDTLMFVERGRINVLRETPERPAVRVRSFASHCLLGEVAFSWNGPARQRCTLSTGIGMGPWIGVQ